MLIQWLTYDVTIILAVFLGLFIILYVRKNVKFNHKNRLTPYKEPLVPEGFWKICRPSDPPTIVWIVPNYLPDFKTGATTMAHDINRYFKEVLGWDVIVVTPHSSVTSHGGIPILQFYQAFEIEVAISKAYCLFSQSQVVETAASTAQRSRLPLVLFAEDESLGPWIEKAKKLCDRVNIVNNSTWISDINSQYGLNSIILNPPVDWRRYVTHTERRYITLINMNKGVEEFFAIAKALPEYEFLAVAGSNPKDVVPQSSNVTLWKSQNDMRVVYNMTGILCIPSKEKSWSRSAIEAAASGIPVVAGTGLKETLDYAGIFVEDDWINTIRRLKTDGLYYKKYSELSAKRAKELDPKPQLERFRVWVEALKN